MLCCMSAIVSGNKRLTKFYFDLFDRFVAVWIVDNELYSSLFTRMELVFVKSDLRNANTFAKS